MTTNANLNKPTHEMEAGTISKDGESLYQQKDCRTLLVIIFVLYAVITAITWSVWKDIIDPSFVMFVIGLYFFLAKKKLSNGVKVKKFDVSTRQLALFSVCFSVFINVLLLCLFVFLEFGFFK